MSLQHLQLRAKMTHLSRISKYAPDEWKRGIVASALCHPKICYMYDKSAFPRYRSFQPSECFHWPEFSSILHNMTVQWFEWKSKMNGDIRTEECQDWYHPIWAPHFSHTLNFFYKWIWFWALRTNSFPFCMACFQQKSIGDRRENLKAAFFCDMQKAARYWVPSSILGFFLLEKGISHYFYCTSQPHSLFPKHFGHIRPLTYI